MNNSSVFKQRETFRIKVELAEMQQQEASSRPESAKTQVEPEKQEAAQVVKLSDKEEVIEAAVSAITNALQQHLMLPGGQPPVPASTSNTVTQGQATFDMATALRRAATHVE